MNAMMSTQSKMPEWKSDGSGGKEPAYCIVHELINSNGVTMIECFDMSKVDCIGQLWRLVENWMDKSICQLCTVSWFSNSGNLCTVFLLTWLKETCCQSMTSLLVSRSGKVTSVHVSGAKNFKIMYSKTKNRQSIYSTMVICCCSAFSNFLFPGSRFLLWLYGRACW